jgi:hypothetical protein
MLSNTLLCWQCEINLVPGGKINFCKPCEDKLAAEDERDQHVLGSPFTPSASHVRLPLARVPIGLTSAQQIFAPYKKIPEELPPQFSVTSDPRKLSMNGVGRVAITTKISLPSNALDTSLQQVCGQRTGHVLQKTNFVRYGNYAIEECQHCQKLFWVYHRLVLDSNCRHDFSQCSDDSSICKECGFVDQALPG